MPTGTLATYLKTVQQSIERNAPHAVISLMPGFDFPTLNDQWLVKTP